MTNVRTSAVVVVSATRMTESEFWQKSALGQSIKEFRYSKSTLSTYVAFENQHGLPDIYNQAIDRADTNATLVFIHDDVWVEDDDFINSIETGLSKFDVIGVAGNRYIKPNQPSWAFVDTRFTWDDRANLSGSIQHGESRNGLRSCYGPSRVKCELLDGVFLAVKKQTLVSNDIKFDPQFRFHFYDMDFCRTATSSCLNLGTWPITMTHQSAGNFGNRQWQKSLKLYFAK